MATKVLIYNTVTGLLQLQAAAAAAITSGSIVSGSIAPGAIVSGVFAAGAVTSNAIASGQLGFPFISDVGPLQDNSFSAQNIVSAFQAVQFSISGGFFSIARAESGSLPAVGIKDGLNVLSGQLGAIIFGGRVVNTGWNFSGYVGQPIYLGTSSQLVTSAPFNSGEYVQRMGQVIDATRVFLQPDAFYTQVGA